MTLDPGEHAVKWLQNLTLTDDYAGQPFSLRPWQAEIPRKLYGTLRTDGLRQYRRCFLLLPRKQAKSTLAAGIACYDLLGTGRNGQCVVLAAGSTKQASHIFDKIVQMIEHDPFLRKQVNVYASAKQIKVKRSNNLLQVVSSEGRLQLGSNPSMLIIDELLAQPNRKLFSALTSAFGTRREPLTLLISTAGDNHKSLVGEEYEYACKVRDGVIEDSTYLPIIYEGRENGVDLDWHLESTWQKAMPALGDFNSIEFMRAEYAKAKEIPAEEATFRQFYLCHWIASANKWLNQAKWAACGQHTFDEAELLGKPCYAGLDLSNTSDVTALCLVFPWHDGTYRVKCHFWIPRGYALMRDRKGHTHYQHWHDKGLIKFTVGDEIDYPEIEADIPKLLAPYTCKKVLADPYNATGTLQRLVAAGLPVVKHRQGWQSMSAPIKHTEVVISKEQLHHNNNAVLDWMASNVVACRDKAGNLTFDKANSADKIDGVVAVTIAIAGHLLETIKKPSVYERRGAIII